MTSAAANHLTASFSYKDILLRKIYRAVAASVLSQVALLLVYLFVGNLNILHPIEWIKSTINTFTIPSTWFFVAVFIAVIFAQSITCAKDYVLVSSYSSTRFQQFVHIFSLHNLVLLALHIVVATVSVWQSLSMVGGHRLVLTGQHLDPNTFFLVLNGCCTGIYYHARVHGATASKSLTFPVVQQRKWLQFRNNIALLIGISFKSSLFPTMCYALFYFGCGNQIRTGFQVAVFGRLDVDNDLASSFTSTCWLYVYSWWLTSWYFLSMNLMRFYFQLFLTESVEFPLVNNDPKQSTVLTLQNAIAGNNLPPIIRNLACLDLFLLAQWSQTRRIVLFELSQPGAHPHNWNSLVDSLLKLFTDYTDMLNKSTMDSSNSNPLISEGHQVIKQLKPSTLQEQEEVATTTTLRSPRFKNLRNMSATTSHHYYDDDDYYTNLSGGAALIERTDNANLVALKQAVRAKCERLVAFLWVVLGVRYLFGELPQANVQKCLSGGHLIMWASQGIAELAAASLHEDQYGIVQKDLPVIITSLVQLKLALDRLGKVVIVAAAGSRSHTPVLHHNSNDFNYRMKVAISGAVKRSLFSVCYTFRGYLNDVSLQSDIRQYLQTNILFKNND